MIVWILITERLGSMELRNSELSFETASQLAEFGKALKFNLSRIMQITKLFTAGCWLRMTKWCFLQKNSNKCIYFFLCSPEVFSLAVNYMDRVLSQVNISKHQFQLLGSVCIFLASKFKESSPLCAEKLVICSDFSFTTEEIMVSFENF